MQFSDRLGQFPAHGSRLIVEVCSGFRDPGRILDASILQLDASRHQLIRELINKLAGGAQRGPTTTEEGYLFFHAIDDHHRD